MKKCPEQKKTYYGYASGSIYPARARMPILKFVGKKIIGYKKAYHRTDKWTKTECIVVLEIGAHTRAQQSNGQKCRAASARVLRFETINGEPLKGVTKKRPVISSYDPDFIYRKGEIARPKLPYEPRYRECESGIHFFLDRQRAADY